MTIVDTNQIQEHCGNLALRSLTRDDRGRTVYVRPRYSEDRIITKEELLAWCSYLKEHNVLLSSFVESCNRDPIIQKTCSQFGERHSFKVAYNRCNKRCLCPRCAYLSAHQRAHEAYRFIQENIAKNLRFRLYTIHLVLTLTHDLDDTDDRELVRAAQELLRNYQEKGEETAYLYIVQNESSQNPLKRHKHIHLYLLNVGLMTDKNGRYYTKRRRPYFEVDDYVLDGEKRDGLRSLWKKVVERRYGVNVLTPMDIHLEYSKFSNKGKQLHWLSYMYRYPSWDLFKKQVRRGESCDCRICYFAHQIPGSGASPRLCSDLTLGQVLLRKNKATWKGFLSNTKRKTMLRAFTQEPKLPATIRIILKTEANRCPICKSPMKSVNVLTPIESDGEEEDVEPTPSDWGELEIDPEDLPEYAREWIEDDLKSWAWHDGENQESSLRARRARVNNW